MNPIVHGELGWLLGQPLRERRDRLLVTVAGVIPDVDGLTLLLGEGAYARWHHVLSHGLLGAAVCAVAVGGLARDRLRAAGLAFLSFHLHLLCDLAGSGPGWPLYYWWPFNRTEWFWDGQWDLASWQNSAIGLAVTLLCLSFALFKGRTPVELFSPRWDAQVVATLRRRFAP